MKKTFTILLVLSLVAITTYNLTGCTITEKEKEDNKEELHKEDTAVSFIENLTSGEYEEAYDNYKFDEKMKEAINPEVLEQIIEQLQSSTGKFIKIVETNEKTNGDYKIIAVTCEFEKEYMDLNVVFNEKEEISGFNFTKPVGYEKSNKNTDDRNEEDISDRPESIEEYEVIIGEGEWKLPGTLSIPKGNTTYPAVVLVHGSGPSDRDATIGFNKPFRDIAWQLSEKGIAVLRYEKRTKEHQQKVIEMSEEFTVKEETIDDSLSAVNFLRNHEKINNDQIYVLGHSMGGYLIPRIGVQDEDIAGFIIMAGSTRPMEDLIVEQVEYIAGLDGEISEAEKNQIENLKEFQKKIKSEELRKDTNANELMGVNANYWLDLRGYNPTEMVKELDRPILVLQGERDYQVTMEDFNNWKDALENEKAIFKSFEKLNHLLMAGEGKATPNDYSKEGKVSAEVIHEISMFINEKK